MLQPAFAPLIIQEGDTPVIDEDKRDSSYDPGLLFNSRHCGVNAGRFPSESSPMKMFVELLTYKLECGMINGTNSFALHVRLDEEFSHEERRKERSALYFSELRIS